MGMTTKDSEGNIAAAKKRTGILTNSDSVASLLRDAQCQGDHEHEQLLSGKAGPCQTYPERFCRAVCEGVKHDIDTIRWKQRHP